MSRGFFDITAPFYELIHPGAKKSFLKIKELGDFQKEDRILDLGGGVARVAKFFINQAKEIIVVDSSLAMIKKCQSRKGLSCILARAEELPFADNYFDKIIIVEAFHHF